MNTDEKGRQVFDGVMAHIAGGARLDVNRRWATPTGLGTYAATAFPFADAAQKDPVSGVTDGLLDNPRARTNQPKIFYTNTGVEYWGGGRSAALIHTTADGAQGPHAAGERAHVFLRRQPARTVGVSAAVGTGPAESEPDRLLVDDARARRLDGEVGDATARCRRRASIRSCRTARW